jgi:hypothetical protein
VRNPCKDLPPLSEDNIEYMRALVAGHNAWRSTPGWLNDKTEAILMEEEAQLYALECEPGPDAGNHDPGTEDGHYARQCKPGWPCWEGKPNG